MILDRVDDILVGAKIAAFSVNAFLLIMHRYQPNTARRALTACACLMIYAALGGVVTDLLPIFFPSLATNMMTIHNLLSMIMVPLCVFVLMELTRLQEVNMFTAVVHLCVPVLLNILYLFAIATGSTFGNWIMWICVYYIIIYSAFMLWQLIRAARVYESEAADIYADTQGHSLNWFRNIIGISLLALITYMVLNVFVDSHYAQEAYSILCIIIWTSLSYYVSIMRYSEKIQLFSVANSGLQAFKPNNNNANKKADADIPQDEALRIMTNFNSVLSNKKLLVSETLNREDIAKYLKVTNVALSKAIKQITGMTFSGYVGDLRLQYAAELLVTTDQSIEEVISNSGHLSKPVFYRGFTQKYHCTPSEYRNGKRVNV